jgi:ribosomal protein L11 methyltransferase
LADPAARTWPALDLDARPGVPLPPDFEDRLALVLDEVSPVAVEERSGARWRVYFDDIAVRDAATGAVTEGLGAWLDVTPVAVADEGWALKVQRDLGAVRVGRLVVAPPWDVPAREAGARGGGPIVVVIEPSMGFGTGHHQSTRVCLLALQALDLRGARVIDAGTGSGVLAIAAARLGAAGVAALDNDVDAVEAARANVARNGVDDTVTCRVADLEFLEAPPASVVVANLTAHLLRRFATRIRALVALGGALVTSGFTADQVPLVLDAFPGFAVRARHDEDGWVCLTLGR